MRSVVRSQNIISITVDTPDACIPEMGNTAFDVTANLGVLPVGVYDVVVGGPGNLLIGLAEGFLPVTETIPSFRIAPNTVSASGGDIRLSGPIVFCATGPSPVVCGNATVTIDGVNARVKSKGNGELVAEAPPHAPGVVNVKVQGDAGTFTRTAALNFFDPAGRTRDAAFFERILVPVFFSGPGANGSQWRTQAAAHNGNDFPVTGDGIFNLAPNTSTVVDGTNVPTGRVEFVPRQATPGLDFNLLVRDVSRDATDFGTSVPLVRENEVFTRRFSLVNVPSDARYRIGLRLYAYDTIPTQMSVALSTLDGSFSVGNAATLLPATDHAFLLIGDLLAAYPSLIGKGPLRIDIAPVEPATRAWGYVTITNNDTQHVTVIAPE